MWQINVPASSANLGPGFDSIGIAVNRYLTLNISEHEEWLFTSDSSELEDVPSGKDNLIYKVAAHIAEQEGYPSLPPVHVHMTSDIPLARGLGSSAAAIIAAIELADVLLTLKLTKEEKMRYASLWEGHPDNVGPCLYGGLIVGSHSSDETDMVHCGVPDVDLVMLIPEEELLTKEARGILPSELKYDHAISGSAVSNVLVAALLKKDWELVGKMMNRDLFHHPYRASLVPGLTDLLQNAKDYGAYGAALSGAGPTVMCFVPAGEGDHIQQLLQADYPQYRVQSAKPAPFGATVKYVKEKARAGLS